MSNLLVIDFSVICHNIYAEISKLNEETLEYASKFYKKNNPKNKGLFTHDWLSKRFVVLQWYRYILSGTPHLNLDSFVPVCVCDAKPYWRSKFEPTYKEGRKPKTAEFYGVRDLGQSVCESLGIPYLSFYGFEADDIAGAIVKIQHLAKLIKHPFSEDNIYLYTVDTDWLQLINKTVVWVNTGPWQPVVRDLSNYNEWTQKRLNTQFNDPQEIVAHKCIHGDKSDNLPPGTKPYLIDLLNPHPDYNLISAYPGFVETVLNFRNSETTSIALKNNYNRAIKELNYFVV